MDKNKLAPPGQRTWTRPDDYFESLARRRTARRKREPRPRGQSESTGPLLNALPFLALMAGLAILAVSIAIAAWPGRVMTKAAPKAPAAQLGTAAPGWIDRPARN